MDQNTKTILLFTLFSLYLSFSNISVAETPYTYDQNPDNGPKGWSKLDHQWKTCNNGKLQSPIDLTNARGSRVHSEAWKIHHKPAEAVIMSRRHDIMVRPLSLFS